MNNSYKLLEIAFKIYIQLDRIFKIQIQLAIRMLYRMKFRAKTKFMKIKIRKNN